MTDSGKKTVRSVTLSLRDLTIETPSRTLLAPADVDFPDDQISLILGASGVGKSVLLRVIAGLLQRHGEGINWSGQVRTVTAPSADAGQCEAADQTDARIGVVFQQYALFDELSAAENVQFAIDHQSDEEASDQLTARQWLAELEVPSDVAVSRLSGGQKQRLAIARTLAAAPDVVLYDEPSSGLDSATGRKVARLIRQTQQMHRRTSIVVTHDYQTMLEIADNVFVFDSATRQLVNVPRDQWSEIENQIQSVVLDGQSNAVVQEPQSSQMQKPNAVASHSADSGKRLRREVLRKLDHAMIQTGSVAVKAMTLPWQLRPLVPSTRWAARFFLHYFRIVGGFSAMVYLILAGVIAGFTTTFFTFKFLPFKLYTQPLLVDELLSSIGFALYRVLVPVLATILIAARCGSAVAADVSVKRYSGAVDAMRTFSVSPRQYLLIPIVLAFVVAAPWLEWLAFESASLVSAVTFSAIHPEIGPQFWNQHFSRRLLESGSWLPIGFGWLMVKNLACGVGSGVIGYYHGLSPKNSAVDVSHAITATVLWSTLLVLVVHFVTALFEF